VWNPRLEDANVPGASGPTPQWTNPDDSNILPDFDELDAAWGTADNVIILNGETAPDGTMTATKITTASGPNGNYLQGYSRQSNEAAGHAVTASFWVKSLGPDQNMTFGLYAGAMGVTTPVHLTGNWQQVSLSGVVPTNAQRVIFQLIPAGPLSNFAIWLPKMEMEGDRGLSVTNYLPNSQRLTASSWQSVQATVAENSTTAPDGSNTGAAITAATGGSNAAVYDSLANPQQYGKDPVLGSIWLKLPDGATGTQQVSLSLMGTLSSGRVSFGSKPVTLTTSWQRFIVSGVVAEGATEVSLQVGGNIGGNGTLTNGQVINAWGAQMEIVSTTLTSPVPGPYVATASTPVTQGTNLTNLLTYSQKEDGPTWASYQTTFVVNAAVAPDGSHTAAIATGQPTGGYFINVNPLPALYNLQTVTASIYLRSHSGTPQNITMWITEQDASGYPAIAAKVVSVDNNWQRFALTGTAGNGLKQLYLQVGGGDFSDVHTLEVWGSQMEIGSQAGPYVATNALPVMAGKEPVNLFPTSQMQSGPEWSWYQANAASNSTAAPDGTVTAATVTPTTGSTDTYLIHTVPNPSLYDGQTLTVSVYLKVPSGTQSVNLYFSESGESGSGLIAPLKSAVLNTTWKRFDLTGTAQNGLTSLYLQIGGAGTFQAGQIIQVWGAQMVIADTPAPYTPTNNLAVYAPVGTPGASVPNGLNEAYSYDSFGNILQNNSFQPTYNAKNQMVGYSYDAAGNLLADGINNITWDAESRIATVGGATYIYDADGNRVEKQGAGVIDTVYFGGHPIARLQNGQWTDLIYGPNGLLAEVPGTQNGLPVYRVTDHLGTTVGNLLSNGSFVNPVDYKPFGQIFSGNTNDPYLFTGKERDAESGNDYVGARYYASNMGRWMSPDWSAKAMPVPYAKLDNPQSLNLYTYVENNPLSGIDPDGHAAIDCSGSNASGAGCQSIARWNANHDVLSTESKAAIANSKMTADQQKSFTKAVETGADKGHIDPNILVGMAQQESTLGADMDPQGPARGLYGIQDPQMNQMNKMFSMDITRTDVLSLGAGSMMKVSTGVGEYLGHYADLYSNWSDPRGIDIAIGFWRVGGGNARQALRSGTFWDYVAPTDRFKEKLSHYIDQVEQYQ
jgi:RHS repeat-associated protein